MSQHIDAALDAVLRRAVANKGDAVIEAYRHIWSGSRIRRTSEEEPLHAALRLGLLLGAECKRQESRG